MEFEQIENLAAAPNVEVDLLAARAFLEQFTNCIEAACLRSPAWINLGSEDPIRRPFTIAGILIECFDFSGRLLNGPFLRIGAQMWLVELGLDVPHAFPMLRSTRI